MLATVLKKATPAARRNAPRSDPRLEPIRDRLAGGERLSLDEGDVLYTTPDIWGLCELADSVRRRLHGDVAYYNVNRHFNYTNVCALSCAFCEFHRKAGDEGAFTRDFDFAREEARKAAAAGATEMHIVGGLHPTLPFSYYTDLLRTLRDAAPSLHLKAFTAVEIVHLAKIAKVFRQSDRAAGIRWVLEQLIDAGLGSLPGGGAEVFDDRVHDEAFKGKIRSDVWLDVHRVAHELCLHTNATILYGHIEDRRERLVHMDMLRRAQDTALARLGYPSDSTGAITLTRPETPLPTPGMSNANPRVPAGYFQTIIPLPFLPDGSDLEHLPGPGGLENLRTLAVARLMLDNIPHVKAFWIMQTLSMAQLMLQCGADDLDGTVVWYDITKLGGSSTHQETTVWDLQRAIREAGFTPVERDTLYRRVVRVETSPIKAPGLR
jgi:aminodeoxyfutalosine synthase